MSVLGCGNATTDLASFHGTGQCWEWSPILAFLAQQKALQKFHPATASYGWTHIKKHIYVWYIHIYMYVWYGYIYISIYLCTHTVCMVHAGINTTNSTHEIFPTILFKVPPLKGSKKIEYELNWENSIPKIKRTPAFLIVITRIQHKPQKQTTQPIQKKTDSQGVSQSPIFVVDPIPRFVEVKTWGHQDLVKQVSRLFFLKLKKKRGGSQTISSSWLFERYFWRFSWQKLFF